MNFIRNSAIRVPMVFEEEAWFKQIVSDLTRNERDYDNPSVTITKKYYSVVDGNLLIPRFYPVEKLGHMSTVYLNHGEDIDLKFKSTFRNEQQERASNYMVENDSGVLCMLPGEGKTVVAISAVCRMGKKTIVFVHKDSLATQWMERFLEHSTVSKEKISVISTSSYQDFFDKDVIICTVQTFGSMIKRLPNFESIIAKANFGIAIWDECHTSVSAEWFSRTSLNVPAWKTFGLSATPSRADGNTDIIHLHLGNIFRPDGETDTLAPRVVVLFMDCRAVALHEKFIYSKEIQGKHIWKFDKKRYLNMLTSQKNKYFMEDLKRVVKNVYDSKRRAILLADRIKILDQASTVLPKHEIGFFLPREKSKRDSALDKQFVFSTYGSARDGTDQPELDCLIMATNTGNFEQAIGRICRPLKTGTKQQPVVIDIVDVGCEEMMKSFEYRKAFYEEKGWEIVEKHIKRNK